VAGSLRDVEAKIGRAKDHFWDLKAETEKVKAACREAVVHTYEPATQTQVITLAKVPKVPLELSLILGDALHNLRAALDYLAWQLVLASGGQPDDNTSFPVLRTPPTPGRYRPTHPQIPPGVTPAIRAVLDTVQPYQRADPDRHQLALLHDADIADKHHALLVTTDIDMGGAAWVGEEFQPNWFGSGPFEDGAELCRTPGLTAEQSKQWRPTVTFVVQVDGIDSPWARDADILLVHLLDYVQNIVVDLCRPFF
jgi:hypothetical protein